jgi:hypothetical protein
MWFILLRRNNLCDTNNALHELSVVNSYLILGKQVAKGHGAEDSGMANPSPSEHLEVAGREGHRAANC